jgi:hypothetical protein
VSGIQLNCNNLQLVYSDEIRKKVAVFIMNCQSKTMKYLLPVTEEQRQELESLGVFRMIESPRVQNRSGYIASIYN